MDPLPLSPGTEGGRAGQGSHEQEAGCLHCKQRPRGDCGREVQTPRCQAACLPWSQGLSVPPAAQGWHIPLCLPHVQRAPCVDGGPRSISTLLGKQPTCADPPRTQPRPSLIRPHFLCLAWPPACGINPLTRCQHPAPANFTPSLISLTGSPHAKPRV